MGNAAGTGYRINTQLTSTHSSACHPTGGGSKVRVVDDFRASGINAAMSTADTDIPESPDFFLAQADFLKRIAPAVENRAFALGFPNA